MCGMTCGVIYVVKAEFLIMWYLCDIYSVNGLCEYT